MNELEVLEKVDEYIRLKESEDSLSAQYHSVKAQREALRDQLSTYMDARSIGSLVSADGRPVSVVATGRLIVTDHVGFIRWCDENGKRGDFIREEMRVGSNQRPGVKQWIEGGGEVPVGVERATSLSLRIGSAKNGGFKDAGLSLVESLEKGVPF